MRTLHVAPGDSAGGGLLQAIRVAGRDEAVLAHLDDLSCGPIASNDPAARAAWWAPFHDASEVEQRLQAFWDRVATTDERFVVWFGRHSASELSFFLAWVDRLGDRPYDIVDVTCVRPPYKRPDGTAATGSPLHAVSIANEHALGALLGSERPLTAPEREAARQCWQRLRTENAPFRVVTPSGLISAPINHFDALLIERASAEWQPAIRIVAETMVGTDDDAYMQVGDVMLFTRVVALVGPGKLVADGDPRQMRTCRIRLAP